MSALARPSYVSGCVKCTLKTSAHRCVISSLKAKMESCAPSVRWFSWASTSVGIGARCSCVGIHFPALGFPPLFAARTDRLHCLRMILRPRGVSRGTAGMGYRGNGISRLMKITGSGGEVFSAFSGSNASLPSVSVVLSCVSAALGVGFRSSGASMGVVV